MARRLRCPKCHAAIEVPPGEAGPSACPSCGAPGPGIAGVERVPSTPAAGYVASLQFDPVPGYVVLDWPMPDEELPAASGHVGAVPDDIVEVGRSAGPGSALQREQANTPRDLYRGSLLLVHERYKHRTGRLKPVAWGVWLDLYHEALTLGLKRRVPLLELALVSSPTMDGWGQLRLVEALRGEVRPETPPPTGYLGAGSAPAQPTTVVVTNGQAQPQEAPKKKSLLGRLRGGP